MDNGKNSQFVYHVKLLVTNVTHHLIQQKYDGIYGLWALNEIIFKIYTENMKNIIGAVWELLAK